MPKVVLDPGHGGTDPGSVNGNIYEKNINLAVGLKVEEFLKPYPITVLYTRTNDVTLDPEPRTSLVNKSNADICVSIHINMYLLGVTGVEAYASVFAKPGNVGYKLATLATNYIAEYTGINNRGVIQKWNSHRNNDYFFMIRNTKMTSIITEGDFISDTPKVTSKEFQEDYAKGISRAIVEYFGLQWQDPKENQKVEQLFEVNGKKYSWNRETGPYGFEGFMLTPTNFVTTFNGHIMTSQNENDFYFGNKKKVEVK